MVNNQNDKIQQVLDRVQDDNIEFIRMEFLDYTGVTRGRTIRNDNLRAAMEDGVNFSTAIMSFDMFDEFIEGGAYGSNDGDFFASGRLISAITMSAPAWASASAIA